MKNDVGVFWPEGSDDSVPEPAVMARLLEDGIELRREDNSIFVAACDFDEFRKFLREAQKLQGEKQNMHGK